MDTWTFLSALTLISATAVLADLPFVTDCQDHDQVDCYKIRGTAECREEWVYEYCPLSCGVCGMLKPDSNKCEDHNRECDSIQSTAHQSCKDIVIKEVCPKSCGVCGHHKHTHPPHLLKTTAKTTAKPATTSPLPTSDTTTNNPITGNMVTVFTKTSSLVITPSPTSSGSSNSPDMGSQLLQSSSRQSFSTHESSQNILESSYPVIVPELSTSKIILTSTKLLVITTSRVVEVPHTSIGMEMSNQLTSTTSSLQGSSAQVVMVKSSDTEVPQSSHMAEVSGMIQPSSSMQQIMSSETVTLPVVTKTETTTVTYNEVTTDSLVTDNEVITDSLVTDNEVTTDSMVTDNEVTTDSMVTDNEVTTNSMVTDNEVTPDSLVTDNEVTTDSMVTDNEVTIDSMVTDNKLTTDSMVTDNEVTTDSMVTDNEVTTDSMVTDNEVTTDSMVTDNEVTTDSLVTDNEVTTDSMVTDNKVTTDSMVTDNEVTGKRLNVFTDMATGSRNTDALETSGPRNQQTMEPVTDTRFTDEFTTQGMVTQNMGTVFTHDNLATNQPIGSDFTEDGTQVVTDGSSMVTQGHRSSDKTEGVTSTDNVVTDTQPMHTNQASGGTGGVTQSHGTFAPQTSQTSNSVTSGEVKPFTPPPLTKTRCQVCDDPFCRIGFANINYCYQHTPYCMSSISFDANGKSTLEKRCASAQECDEKWINRSSKIAKCRDFDKTKTYQTNLQCDFCCVKDNCNAHTLPNKDSWYTKQ